MSGGASGAVLAKIRAMYGKRLTNADFDAMTALGSVSDVASFLSSRQPYAETLAGVDPRTVRRRELEDAVRRARFSELERLCRYELTVREPLADYILSSIEVETLTRAIRVLTPGVTDPPPSGSFSGSRYLDRHLSFDVDEVFRAKTVAEIASAAKKSRYYPLLAAYCGDGDDGPVRLEAALRAEYFGGTIALFSKIDDAEARKEVSAMMRDRIDLENTVAAYRLKKYFGDDGSRIRASFIPGGGMSDGTLDAMASAETPDGALDAARTDGRMKKLLRVLDSCAVIDEAPVRASYARSCHLIRFSSSAATVMASYSNVVSVECDNVIKVIEGKRYGLTAQEIDKLLIREGR
ncbi:MAG: V-type ATPase subunit [Clostridia bacterium]|nr:V-type ATPase subunit [Clostridia bacterium]